MQNFSSGLPSDTKTQVGGLANNVAALLAYFPCVAVLASIVWLATMLTIWQIPQIRKFRLEGRKQ